GRVAITDPAALGTMMGPMVRGLTNIPIVAYLFAVLGLLPLKVSAVVFTLARLGRVLASWRLLITLADIHRFKAALLFLLFAVNGPLLYSLKEGNTSHVLLLPLVGTLVLLRGRRDTAAGIVLGAVTLIKIQLVLLLGLLLLRGRWRAAITGAVVG